MPAEQKDYFFSYSRRDSEFVLELARELRAGGASLWLDQIDLLGGDRWDEAVEDALHRCGGLVVVLSPDSVGSRNVMDEVAYALESGKHVIPVLQRSCEVPFRLRRLHYIDFTADPKRALKDLQRSMQNQPPTSTEGPAAAAPAASPNRGRRRIIDAAIGFASFGAIMAAAHFVTALLPTEQRSPVTHDVPGVIAFVSAVAGLLGVAAALILKRTRRSVVVLVLSSLAGWAIGLFMDPRYEGTEVGLLVGATVGIALAAIVGRRTT